MTEMEIYCCGCFADVKARLTSGAEIYPHRSDLHKIPFWKCKACGNHVGCHYKTKNRTRPLGNIPTPEIRSARQHIHKILDPLWTGKRVSRRRIYERISEKIGYNYHTANIKTIDEARKIYRVIKDLSNDAKRNTH